MNTRTKQAIIATMLKAKRPDLANLMTKINTVKAAGWEDQAVAELAAELDMDVESLDWSDGPAHNSITVEGDKGNNGESEWMVFKTDDDAERYAIDYVREQIEDDPSMFTQSWLKQHLYVTPTDIRIIAGEEADNYVEGIKDEEGRLVEEAGLDDEWEKIEEQKDDLEAKADEEENPQKEKQIRKKIDALVTKQEKLVEKAESIVHDRYYDDIEQRLKDDPMEWAEELGYDISRDMPNWLSIDYDAAAKDAINTDGVAHFLDGYDGEEVELPGRFVAFGTN